MLAVRVMPCLLLRRRALVKTTRFKNANYIGDPVNTLRIFNEKEVDELILLDITATSEARPPQFGLVEEVASECFMPLAYGGGVRTVDDFSRLYSAGVEKVAINAAAIEEPELIRRAADRFGSQSVIVSIDAKRRWLGRYEVMIRGGRTKTGVTPVEHARRIVELGAGEVLLTSIDHDGVMEGYNLELTRRVADAVDVPVIACGGAGELNHLQAAVREGNASAVAMGSMVIYQGLNRAVLVNYPDRAELDPLFT